jgi:hypothetical protein
MRLEVRMLIAAGESSDSSCDGDPIARVKQVAHVQACIGTDVAEIHSSHARSPRALRSIHPPEKQPSANVALTCGTRIGAARAASHGT